VQAVAELVKEGFHLAVGDQRGLAGHRWREVAGQKRDRRLQRIALTHPAPGGGHPGAAAFLRARVKVGVELPAQCAIAVADLVEAHIRMPGIDVIPLMDANAKEPFHDREKPGHDLIGRKPRAQVLGREVVAGLAQPLAVVAHIPGL